MNLLVAAWLFFLPATVFSCGYAYVSTCAHRLDIVVNGNSMPFHVDVCTWMTDFQNHQFGTPSSLILSRANSNTWESCTNRVLNATLFYRIYLTGNSSGNFQSLPLTQLNYTTNGAYHNREYYQEPGLDLLSGLSGGNYTLELYYISDVDFNNDNIPDAQLVRNNNGANYKAFFTKSGPPACSISAGISQIQCQDNGTSSLPDDDTFTFQITVNGSGTGNSWQTTVNGQNLGGSYNTTVAAGPFLISEGNLSFTVMDISNVGCTAAVSVTAPPPCSAEPPPCTRNVLVVVGNGSAPASADQAIINRLSGALNAAVTIADDGSSAASLAEGKDLVIITATVNPHLVNVAFRDVAVPVMLWKKELFDEMQMISTASGQTGNTSNVLNGTIALPAHPLAAGLSGIVPVFSTASTANWGVPLPSAIPVVRLKNNSNKYLVFAYEPSAALASIAAPARRIGFFLHQTFANNLTVSGWALFDAAVIWSTGCDDALQNGDDASFASLVASQSETENIFPDPVAAACHIYPNPAAPGIPVYMTFPPSSFDREAIVVNIQGQIMLKLDIPTGSEPVLELNTEGLLPGWYGVYIRSMVASMGTSGSFILRNGW